MLQTSASNGLRTDYNPSTLALMGLLCEAATTNEVRNNTMQSAAAGTPGTMPTNWTTTAAGLTRTIVGTSISNGINYIDITFTGTTSGTFGQVAFAPNNHIVAANGETWTQSCFVSLIGGDFTNVVNVQMNASQYNSGGTFLSNLAGTSFKSSISAILTATF